MDVPKTNNNYKFPENQVPNILSSKDRNGEGSEFQHSEEDSSKEHQENVQNAFLNSYLKESDSLLVSTNEWLGTWRPIIN